MVFSNPTERARRISEAKKGRPNGRLGYTHTEATKEKIRAARAKQPAPVPAGFTYPRSTTPSVHRLRMTTRYRQWREAVYKRDDYTCQGCGQRGGELNADHEKSFARYPELRFELTNGRTLCVPCHLKTPTFGAKSKRGFVMQLAI